MRPYLGKLMLPDEWMKYSTGKLGELVFKTYFEGRFEGEQLFKQSLDRDYDGIDFADEKGYRYQVKATKAQTYTFNSPLEALSGHLTCDYYVMIQIRDKIAYVESMYTREDILMKAKSSWKDEKTCFIYCKDLLQQKLF